MSEFNTYEAHHVYTKKRGCTARMGQSLQVPLLDSKVYPIGTLGYWWGRKRVHIVQNETYITIVAEGYQTTYSSQLALPFETLHAVQLSAVSIMCYTDQGSRILINRKRHETTKKYALEVLNQSPIDDWST